MLFPPLAANPAEPDFGAMPVFNLLQWAGGENYEFFDGMVVEEDEWETYVLVTFSLPLLFLIRTSPAIIRQRVYADPPPFSDRL